MGLTSGFFDSMDGSLRLYTAEQFSSIFDGLISDGVYENVGSHFNVTKVSTSDSTIKVRVNSGRGWFNHVWVYCDGSDITLDAANATVSRKDTVLLKVDKNQRACSFIKYKGLEDGTNKPSIPDDVPSSGVYYYPIAYITIPANATSSNSCSISQAVGSTKTPWIKAVVQPSMNFEAYAKAYDNQLTTALQNLESDIGDWKDDIVNYLNVEEKDVEVGARLSAMDSRIGKEITDRTTDVNNARSKARSDLEAHRLNEFAHWVAIGSRIDTHDNAANAHKDVLDRIRNSISTIQKSISTIQKTTIPGVANRVTTIENIFKTDLPRYGAAYNINKPKSTISRFDIASGKAGGTKPDAAKMGDYIMVFTMTTNPEAKYNVQIAFGLKYTVAMRCRNGKTSWDPWKYYTFK